MEGPKQIKPKRLNDYLEVMSKAVFQSGMSWQVVEAKWPGFREAFFDFDPDRIAHLSPREVDGLAADTRIIRNRRNGRYETRATYSRTAAGSATVVHGRSTIEVISYGLTREPK